MSRTKTARFVWAVGAVLILAGAPRAAAQNVTTGSLTGVVADQQGGVLPGVTVVATHGPTGTTYENVTGADGRYQMPAVRVGGPYTVTASLPGFKDKTESDIAVGLGEAKTVDFKLPLASVTENVIVVAESPVIDTSRAGTASNISRDVIENLPTINRSILDAARTSPYFNLNPDSANNDAAVSVAGRNNRYNNMQIDGAVNNDVFGLAATGTPGGQTGTTPISYDAIQEIQLVVAPYDVRQGGFSGGGVNAVTRSGTNAFAGTGYVFWRNQNLVGTIPAIATVASPSPADIKFGDFTDRQGGFSVGGPIRKNKAFFFTNLDWARKAIPTGFSVSGNTGQPWSHQAEVAQIAQIAKSQYGFDAGNLDEVSPPTTSDKFFLRSDINLSSRNQLTLRINSVSGVRQLTSSGIPSTTIYAFPSAYYRIEDKVIAPVGQLNTTWNRAFNEFRVTYQRERNKRTTPDFPTFPYVRVNLPDGTNVRLGTENSSHANELDQDISEVTDDLTLIRGTHTITIGTHNEFFKFRNLFIQNLYGQYEFSSIANFQAAVAQLYAVGYSNTSDPRQSAEFSVRQFGVYAGDQWRPRADLTVTYGVRLDAPNFPDKPHANPLTVADFGLATDVVPAPKMWSPRIGFNYDLSHGSMTRSQLRGGVGYFTGRTPYVWLSNQYGNTGVDFTTISVNFNSALRLPFVADPNNQPKQVSGGVAGRQSPNLIDPNYKYPAVVRTNIGYDRDLGIWGLVGTGEFLYTKNMQEILYQNINYVRTGATLPDGRFVYTKFDTNLNDTLLLTNTAQGSSWTASYKVDKPFRNGWSFSGAYIYGRSWSVNDGTASTAGSNWRNNPARIDTNNPELTRSNYDLGNRINFGAVIPIPLGSRVRSTASVYYNGQNGRPYVIMFNGDANGDGSTNNDIAFVPASPDQVVLTVGTWEQLNRFLSNDPASRDNRGTIPARNSGRAPWSNSVDFRYAVNVPTGGKTRVDFTMDIFNLMNLFNKEWGWQFFPLFPSSSGNGLIIYQGLDPATGKERLSLATINNPNFLGTFQRDDQRSRWQAQWGLRVRF